MEFRVIKNDADYESAVAVAEEIVARDPEAGTVDADQLDLLSVLIEDYEKKQFKFSVPDPISAIKFRMEEQGLRQADLVPLLGSRSRVSEVLSGKRPLTVQMIRALTAGLGIPAEVLVRERASENTDYGDVASEIDWNRFPTKVMEERGWFDVTGLSRSVPSEVRVKEFFSTLTQEPALALYRRRLLGEGLSDQNRYSVLAWTARVLSRAKLESPDAEPFDPSRISLDFVRELGRLSYFEEGPRLAKEFLSKAGITLIVEPKLPRTQLDGVAILTEGNRGVIGLTLRFDRVDAFWFTLLHETIHIWRHLQSAREVFVDRLEQIDGSDIREKEANRLAREALIPRAIWKRSKAFLSPTRDAMLELAEKLRIHPAIVVGRLHFETRNYKTFNELLGQRSVRKHFPEFKVGP
jgi:HTH-type transcriptional regulator/antitoxin HigA